MLQWYQEQTSSRTDAGRGDIHMGSTTQEDRAVKVLTGVCTVREQTSDTHPRRKQMYALTQVSRRTAMMRYRGNSRSYSLAIIPMFFKAGLLAHREKCIHSWEALLFI